MHELTKIASKYKHATDKCPETTYRIKHSYTEFYGPLFYPVKDNSLNVLEIGVRWGGSMLMWRDYFKNSQIYGVDIRFDQLRVDISDPRIHTIKANAYTQEVIDIFKEQKIKFDIILEDGEHIWTNQLYVLEEYKEILKDNGVICAEDVTSDENVSHIFNEFKGDTNRLSLIDRTRCKTAYFDERIMIYHG